MPLTSGYWGWKNWGTFKWGDGGTTFMTGESFTAVTVGLEGVPSLGPAQDGAWTETDQDGAWTEPPFDGAYTQDNQYIDEIKPANVGYSKEAVPTT